MSRWIERSDQGIEATLVQLMAEVGVEASLPPAGPRSVVPGGLVEARSVAVSDASRLCRAMAMLTVALAKHQGKVVEQKIVVERVTNVAVVSRGR
jgi:hypothetical protein